MDPTAFLRDASGHAEGGASGHAYRSTCSWGPTGRTQWTPCGLQSRSVENQRHVYCGIFDSYRFAEAAVRQNCGPAGLPPDLYEAMDRSWTRTLAVRPAETVSGVTRRSELWRVP